MLPAHQRGEPSWTELRSMGLGWWLRSTNKLRRCIEKVREKSLSEHDMQCFNRSCFVVTVKP